MSETEGGVASDRAGAVQNLSYAVGGHTQLSGESGGAHIESFEFFGQVFAWMDCGKWHDD
jgi:hypothetical protein